MLSPLDTEAVSKGFDGLVYGQYGSIDYSLLGFWSSIALLIILTCIFIIRATVSFKHKRKLSSQLVSREHQISGSLLELHRKGTALSHKIDDMNFIFIDMSTNPIITPAVMEIEDSFSAWEDKVNSFLDRCFPAYSSEFKSISATLHVRRRRLEEQLRLLSGIMTKTTNDTY